MWSNGGPGSSSLLGWLTENGPYTMQENSTDFIPNPYAWNNNASILYFEHPAGVGFSTCDKSNNGDCDHSDKSDAIDNLATLQAWMNKFEEYRNHSLYLSGESYAGIYMPLLLNEIDIINNYNLTRPEDKINVKGMIVGNGVTNWKYDTLPASIYMTHDHSIISD